MRRFFTTENAEGREKPSVKLGCSCGQHSRLDSSFPCFGQELFTTENTEGTERKPEERKPEERKPEEIFSVGSVFSVVNTLFDCHARREDQLCF